MKLDRDINDGKGKYAIVRLRNIAECDEAFGLLKRLEELGHLDWGCVGAEDEFFVIKLRDKYAGTALRAYGAAVLDDAFKSPDVEASKGLTEYALAVQEMEGRAGILSPFCKTPD